MRFPPLPISLVIAAAVASSGCANKPLASVDRSIYRTAAISPSVKMPGKYHYADLTGERARGAAAQFGLVGALAGAAVAASSEGPGRQRFDRVVATNPVDVRGLLHSQFEKTLRESKLFALTPANPDATFHLVVDSYGVAPANKRELGGVITAQATLLDRTGKTIWSRRESALSNTTAMLEGYEANPRLWPQVMEEAAQQLTRKLVLYTDAARR